MERIVPDRWAFWKRNQLHRTITASVRFAERNCAFNLAGRVHHANFARAKTRADPCVVDCVILALEHRLNAAIFGFWQQVLIRGHNLVNPLRRTEVTPKTGNGCHSAWFFQVRETQSATALITARPELHKICMECSAVGSRLRPDRPASDLILAR